MTGLPHFHAIDFQGEYPLAELTFHDERFPGQVKLLAFNPLIPLNDKDSSIPAAFFEFSITNTTAETLTYTLAGVLANPLPANNLNTITTTSALQALHLLQALDREERRLRDSPVSLHGSNRQSSVPFQ